MTFAYAHENVIIVYGERMPEYEPVILALGYIAELLKVLVEIGIVPDFCLLLGAGALCCE